MGAVCCCFSVPDVAASNDQHNNFCKCFSCCFQNFINKCGTIFGQAQETVGTSANQGPSSSTALVATNSSCNTIRPQDGGLPNSASPRQPQMQQDVAFRRQDKGTSQSRVEPEPNIDADVEITQKLLKAELLKSDCANQGPSSSTALVATNSSCNTIRPHDGGLPNTAAAPTKPLMQQDVAFRQQNKGTSHPQVLPDPDIDADADVVTEKLLREDKLLKSDCNKGSKECCPEFPKKDYSSMMVTGVQYEFSSSEDEDVCPTCLEEYTPENPKISTKCSHHYHLSCIYEWQERSEKCPVCGKLMEFEETN